MSRMSFAHRTTEVLCITCQWCVEVLPSMRRCHMSMLRHLRTVCLFVKIFDVKVCLVQIDTF